VIRTIQSIARTRRLTAWSKAFAAVAKYREVPNPFRRESGCLRVPLSPWVNPTGTLKFWTLAARIWYLHTKRPPTEAAPSVRCPCMTLGRALCGFGPRCLAPRADWRRCACNCRWQFQRNPFEKSPGDAGAFSDQPSPTHAKSTATTTDMSRSSSEPVPELTSLKCALNVRGGHLRH